MAGLRARKHRGRGFADAAPDGPAPKAALDPAGRLGPGVLVDA